MSKAINGGGGGGGLGVPQPRRQFAADAGAPVDVGRGHAVQHDAAVALDGLDRAQEGPRLQQAQFTLNVIVVSVSFE